MVEPRLPMLLALHKVFLAFDRISDERPIRRHRWRYKAQVFFNSGPALLGGIGPQKQRRLAQAGRMFPRADTGEGFTDADDVQAKRGALEAVVREWVGVITSVSE